jgi:hypothetical protein
MKEALSSPKRLFLQEPRGVISQKTPFFIVSAVKTSNLPLQLCAEICTDRECYSYSSISLSMVVGNCTANRKNSKNRCHRGWCLLSNFVILLINSMAFSRQANYTAWATDVGPRILVPTFADRGVSRGQSGGSFTAVNVCFLDRNRYFIFPVAIQLSLRGWVDPVPDPLLLRKSGNAGNWEVGNCESAARNCDH